MNTSDFELDPSTALYMVSEHMPKYVGRPALRLLRLDGEDAVGRTLRYRLLAHDARSIAADWSPCGEKGRSDADAMLGQQLGVCIALDGGPAASRAAPEQRWRWINGIVTGLRYLDADPRARQVEFVLEPWLALARMRNHYRIFQDQTVPEIVRSVLEAYGRPLDMRCADSYPKLDYQVQYGETDFDFVSRLMAQWGLAYHFEHAVADPRARRVPAHTMVVSDQHTACTTQPCPAYQDLPLQPRTDAHAEHDRPVIHAFDMQRSLHCSHSQVWDYDFEHPTYRIDQETTATVPLEVLPLRETIELHWPGGFDEEMRQAHAARHLAQVRQWFAERDNCVAHGHGRLRALCAGHSFTLSAHPVANENKPQRVTHARLRVSACPEGEPHGTPGLDVHCEFRARAVFRPVVAEAARDRDGVLRRPRVFGVQSARVVGPPDTSIWTDEHARVRVRFYWDRTDQACEQCSCWIRVAAPAAGGTQGYAGVPRVGQEVVVAFEHGDPDRPLIIGCVRGPANRPNWRLPSQNPLSGWRTRELKGDTGNRAMGRSNQLVFDDTESELQVQLSSDQAHSSLSLGCVTRVAGTDGRQDARGEGFELRSDAFGALRGGAGLSLSSHARTRASGRIDELQESRERLLQAAQQQQVHANMASQAGLADAAEQEQVAQDLLAGARGVISPGEPAGPATRAQANVDLGAAASLHAVAERHVHVAAGERLSLNSGEHASLSSGGSLLASAAHAIRLFAWRAGLRLMAYAGDVDIRALQHSVRIWAKLRLEESAEHISIRADKQLLLQGADSALCLDPEGVRVHAATLQVHAALDVRSGSPLGLNSRGAPELAEFIRQARMATPSGSPWNLLEYRMTGADTESDELPSILHQTCPQALTRKLQTAACRDAPTALHFERLAPAYSSAEQA